MGWWKVEGSEDVVGDEVFSELRNAALAVAARYEEQCGRPPTRSEWERLITDAMQPLESLESPTTRSLIAHESRRPSSVEIKIRDTRA